MQKFLFLLVVLLMATASHAQLKKPPCTAIPKSATTTTSTSTFKIDTTPGRGVGDNYKMWDNGQVLTVKFVKPSSKFLRNLVMQYAKEWELYANVKFKLVPDNAPNALIRIDLGDGEGHNSAVGTDATKSEWFPKKQ